MSSLSLFLYIGIIFARLSELVKTPWARDIFIKFGSIGARILTLALIRLVGILSQSTLLLFLSLFMTLVISVVDVWVKFSNSGI